MSQQIDNQIVKMQFDNSSFEKNVKESMSTIDKLKAALKFDDSSKGLENLDKQVNSMDMNKLMDACDAVTKKFSFLGTVADQILRDITTKVAQTAEKMVKSFTIDQVSSGWEKYAEKTTAVQTIMANTVKDVGEGLKWKDQAEQMAAVTEQIEKLNWFTDETSYSLTDMTNNIGKFVAQSVDLEKAADAMMGISTWAAVSGQNKTQAQMAMYNLSQSLGAGAVKAIDWKSIENANMATAEFKQTVIDTAKALGVLDEATGTINKAYITAAKYSGPAAVSVENFRDTLSSGWFNSDVLMQSLEKYGGFANKMNELYNVVNRNGMVSTTSNLLKVLDEVGSGSADAAKHIESLAKSSDMATEDLQKLFDELSKPEYDLGKRAFAAAQEAKTFQEAIEATSDAVASEWMGIFEAIFGNYLEAKELWTDLANSLWDIFAGPLDNIKWGLIEWKDAEVTVFDQMEGKWKTMTGRELLLNAVATAINNIGEALEIVRSALAEVFPIFRVFVTEGDEAFDTSEAADGFMNFTKALKGFADSLKLSEDAANTLHTVVRLLATGVKIAFDVVGAFFSGIFKLVGPIFNIADAIFGLIGKIISALTGNNTIVGFADQLNAGAQKVQSVYLAIMDKVAWVLNKIADLIRGFPDSDVFKKIGEGFRYMKDQFVAFWEGFVQMPIIQEMIQDFWNTVNKIEAKITPIFRSIQDGATKAGEAIKSAFTFENLNKAITFLYEKLKMVVNAIKDFVARIKDFVSGIKDGKSVVESFKDSFGDIIEKIKEFKDNIMNFFSDVGDKFNELGIDGTLQTISDGIRDFVANITPQQVTMLAIAGGFMLIALNLLRLSDALTDALTAFSGIGKSIKKVIDSYVKRQKSAIMQVAESIVMVAASLWVLSTIPADKLDNAIGAMWGVVGALSVLMALSTIAAVVLKKTESGSMVNLATGVVLMSGAFMVAALSLKVLEGVNLEGVLPKIATVGLILGGMAFLAGLMRKLDTFAKGSLTLIAIAGALYLAALAMQKIGEIPQAKLKDSIEAMMTIMVGLAALVFAAGHVGVFSGVGLIAVVFTLKKILPMIEDLVNYDYSNIKAGIEKNKEVLQMFAGIVVLIAAVGALAGNRLKGAGIAMIAVAAAMAIFVAVAKLASMMKPTDLQRGEDFIVKMIGMIALLQLCSKKSEKGASTYKGLLKIPVVLGILLGITALAAAMKPEDVAKGELALLGLVGIVAAMLLTARLAVKAEGTIKSISAILFAVSLILAEVALLSMIPLGDMVPAMVAVLSIMGMLALLALAVSKNNKIFNQKREKSTGVAAIITAIVGVVLLGAMMVVLAKNCTIAEIATAGSALTAIILVTTLLMKEISKITKTGQDGEKLKTRMGPIIGAIAMVALIGAALVGMAKLMQATGTDYKGMLVAAAAVSVVLLALTPALKVMGQFTKENQTDTGAMAKAVLMAMAALATVAGAIWFLSNFGGDGMSMITSATALAIGLVAICIPIAVIGAVSKLVKEVKPSSVVGPVVGAVGALLGVAAAIILVSRFGNPATLMDSTKALTLGLMAICVPIAVIGAIGKFVQQVNLGAVATIVGAAIVSMAAVAAILGLFGTLVEPSAIANINAVMPSLTQALLVFSELCVVIAGIAAIMGVTGGAGLLPALGVIGVALLALIGLIGTLTLVGYALNEISGAKDALITGCDALLLVFEAIGNAVGALINGILSGVGEGLGSLADGLVTFSEKMITVSNNMSGIDPQVAESCKTLAEALLIMGGAELLNALGNLIGLSADDLNFESLGIGIAGFANAVSGLTEDMVNKASLCAQIAAQLGNIQGALGAKGGLAGMVFGDKQTIGEFGESLVTFANGLVAFVIALNVLNADHVIKAQIAAEACKPMLDLTSQLSESGGLIQGLMGEKDLGDFGAKLAAFANGLVNFVALIDAITKKWPTYPETIQICADATKPMIDLANSLENMGGVLASLMGDNTLDRFGDTLVPFARDFKRFVRIASETVEDYPNMVGNINQIVRATASLIDLSKNLDNMGGFLAGWSGDNTLDRFGETLGPFGEGIGEFCDNIMDSDIELISAMAEQVTVLVGVCQEAMTVNPESFNNLTYAVAGMVKVFELAGDSDIDGNQFVTMGANIIKGFVTGMENATLTTLNPYINAWIAQLIDLFYKGLAENQFTIYGKNIVNGICEGIRATESIITTKINAMINSIKSTLGVEMASSKFEVYGENVVAGLKKGIDDHADEAISAARSLAEEINRITANTFQEKSPSRVAYKYGMYYDIGLANGISDYSTTAIDSAEEMADDIISGANTIIGALRQAMDDNINTEPVIRPVLDTSDISRKAASIGKLFNAEDLQMAYNASSAMKQSAYASMADSSSDATNEVIGGNQINFTQNNYSPKALSRMEIYRQTKNQLSMMKGVVKSYA